MEDPEDQKVLSLAEQFIAAMPDRIKNEAEEPMHLCAGTSGPSVSPGSHHHHDPASQSDDLGVESMCDDLDLDFNLEESASVAGYGGHGGAHSYHPFAASAYRDIPYTPNSSSMSPESSCLHSPASHTFETPSPCGLSFTAGGGSGRPPSFAVDDSSPPGTAADLQEFLQVSAG